MKSTTERIELQQLQKQRIQIRVIGDTPLICHRFDEKAKKQILDKQMGKVKQGKEKKDPNADFERSLYPYPGGGYGFPSIGFKAAAVTTANDLNIQKVLVRRAFHIMGELVKIEGEPSMREDTVKIGMGTTDIRYRGEFLKWSATLDVVYNSAIINAEQLVNLFEAAGFGVGVGEWRPERDGVNGMFHVAVEGEE